MYQSTGTNREASAKIGPNANLRRIGLRLRSDRSRTGSTRCRQLGRGDLSIDETGKRLE